MNVLYDLYESIFLVIVAAWTQMNLSLHTPCAAKMLERFQENFSVWQRYLHIYFNPIKNFYVFLCHVVRTTSFLVGNQPAAGFLLAS